MSDYDLYYPDTTSAYDFDYSYYSYPTTTSYDTYDPNYQPADINDQYDPYGGDTQGQATNITGDKNDQYDPYGGDTQGQAGGITGGGGTGGGTGGAGASGSGGGAGGGASGSDATKAVTDLFKSLLFDSSGKINPTGLLGLGSLLAMLGKGTAEMPTVGYQGSIPRYTAVRQKVSYPSDPNRRPGSGARKYFTDMEYAANTADSPTAVQDAKARAATAAQGLAAAYKLAEAPKVSTDQKAATTTTPSAVSPAVSLAGVDMTDPAAIYRARSGAPIQAAAGGLMNLAQGRYLGGPTDGMADKIPANIDGKQEARLSHGEFVIPADVVSHLGNGNSESGAQRLYQMMDKIRKARTGTPKQGKQINPNKFIPS